MVWYLMGLGLLGIAVLVALLLVVLFTLLADDGNVGWGIGLFGFLTVLAIGAIGMGFFGWGS